MLFGSRGPRIAIIVLEEGLALVQHAQIREHLLANYAQHIDIEDLQQQTEEARNAAILSRALAAFAIGCAASVDPVAAARSVTDGYGDNGIDAIFYEASERTLYICQSKWNMNHGGSIDTRDTLVFFQGVRTLLNSQFDQFNEKVQIRRSEIHFAIINALKVRVIVAYSGSGTFSCKNQVIARQFIEDVDENEELVSFDVMSQAAFHSALLQGVQAANIETTLTLFQWGQVAEPVLAYYGQVAASDLAELHRRHGQRLFSRNIRMFLGEDTGANANIQKAIQENPEYFWYFNNGVTGLARRVSRTAAGGHNRQSGNFECEGLTIVNGAQTIGSLAAVEQRLPGSTASALVPIRIIALNNAPEGFAAQITRNNNTQNRIDARNFVALDTEQERLRGEFAVAGIDYEYRQGEIEDAGPRKLGLVEATIALACANDDIDLAVQAKREISRLWEDIARPPYRILFNGGVSWEYIWQRVQAFRKIAEELELLQSGSRGKTENIAIHGNRFIMHVCYHLLVQRGHDEALQSATQTDILNACREVLEAAVNAIERHYADNYIASLFKNLTKCRHLKREIITLTQL